ncbi:MAG: hypothetical protein E6Q89_09325 [Bacteroidia bacterium]|nr:MAG: hypothetical protein E6Q89_09325 [Bacteroidia bacterium]
MTAHLLTFCNKKFRLANQLLRQSAYNLGLQNQFRFTEDQFRQTQFYHSHKDITTETFGAGFYLWKPYYILQVLQQLPENDLLLYIDSGQILVADPTPLFDLAAAQPVVLFENYQGYHFFSQSNLTFTEEHCYRTINHIRYWCKADCLKLMNAYENEAVLNSMMVDASVLLFRKCDASIAFVEEWLYHCTDRRSISWDENQLNIPNHPGFIMHIYDQSVLSILAAQQNLRLYRCPSQYGNHLKPKKYREQHEYIILPYSNATHTDDYETITYHHRFKHKKFWLRWKAFLYWELTFWDSVLFSNRKKSPLRRLLKTPIHKQLGG